MRRLQQQGFSLIEMVVVIIVVGIMAAGVTSFIGDSAQAYNRAAQRNQLSSAGRVVVDRIAMELHNALPFSVRISEALTAGDQTANYGYTNDQCIEFIPVEAATTYLNPRFRPAAASAAAFNVVNLVPSQTGGTGLYAVVYPTRESDLYKDSFGSTEAIVALASIADVDTADGTQELTPAAAHRFPRRSPEERLFVTGQPVSFCVVGPKLYRYANYGFYAQQRIPPGSGGCKPGRQCFAGAQNQTPNRALVTDQIDNSGLANGPFDFLATTRRRNGVIQMELNFAQGGESVRLNHEVLQQAAP